MSEDGDISPAAELPADIYVSSRCRLPLVDRDHLDEQTKALFDELSRTSGRNVRGLRGPAGVQLHAPTVARLGRPLGQFLRFESGLSGATRELAILVVARECESNFIWCAHEEVARAEGVAPEIIEIVKYDRSVESLSGEVRIVIDLGREIFGLRKTSASTFAAAKNHFGTTRLLYLIALMGQYSSTAALLCAVDMQLDEGSTPMPPRTGRSRNRLLKKDAAKPQSK